MDIKATVTEANQAFNELLQILDSIPTDKINIVPFEGSWTAGQTVQHIILSGDGIVQSLNGPVKDTDRDFEQNAAQIRDLFLSFDNKFQSPENLYPAKVNYDKQQLINTLQSIKTEYLKAVETLDPTKTCLAFEFPGLGYITRAESITFINTHTIRHLRQLKNISQNL